MPRDKFEHLWKSKKNTARKGFRCGISVSVVLHTPKPQGAVEHYQFYQNKLLAKMLVVHV